jgi:hypothetical protein
MSFETSLCDDRPMTILNSVMEQSLSTRRHLQAPQAVGWPSKFLVRFNNGSVLKTATPRQNIQVPTVNIRRNKQREGVWGCSTEMGKIIGWRHTTD